MKRKKQQSDLSRMDSGVKKFLEYLDKEFQARQNNPNPPYPYNRDTNTIVLPSEINLELESMLKRGEKVETVKRVTRLTGAGLRISKDYVDDMLYKVKK